MIVLTAERLLFNLSKPAVPIDVLGFCLHLDRVIPFAALAVATIITLRPNKLAQCASLDQFRALVPTTGRTALGADLVNPAGLFDGIIHLESFAEVTRHRLLTIHVLPGFHGVDGHLRVPWIVGGDEHCA